MQPVNRSYPSEHYELYKDLLKGLPMQSVSAKYTLSEAQIVNIFYNVTREAKGLPPLPVEPKVLSACDGRVFPLELPDDDPPN